MSTEKSATEQLVDEISEELNRLYRAARGGGSPEKKPRDMAGDFIVRIGQAALSGEYPAMDEAFGVMGRAKGYADTRGFDEGFPGRADVELEIDEHTVAREGLCDGDRLEFIVLPPRAAPGEEEKGE